MVVEDLSPDESVAGNLLEGAIPPKHKRVSSTEAHPSSAPSALPPTGLFVEVLPQEPPL